MTAKERKTLAAMLASALIEHGVRASNLNLSRRQLYADLKKIILGVLDEIWEDKGES